MRLYRKTDDSFEIRIEQSRVVIVAMGVVLLAALIFLLGVLVGKTLWEGEGRDASRRTAGVSEAPAPAAEPGTRKEYGFYDDVRRPEASEASHDPLRRAPAEERETEPAVSVETGRSGASWGEEAVAPPVSAPVAPSTPTPSRAQAESRQALPAPVFTIQVGSFKDRAAARALIESLKAKGIKADISTVSIEGQDWYRIQVGHYATRAEAEKAYRAKLLPTGVKGFVLAR